MGGRKDIASSKYGTTFEAQNWLSLDACGLLGITMSFSVHVFAFFVSARNLIAGSLFATGVYLLIYIPVAMLAVSSLYMAWTTDPGAVPMGARPLVTVKRAASGEITPSDNKRQRGLRRCNKCNDNYKPPRAHHDSITGRCIVKFDHFCPWVGNAVGALNHKFFVLFIFYTLCTCLVTLFLMILRAVHCGFVKPEPSSDDAGTIADVIGGDINDSTANTTSDPDSSSSSTSGTLGDPTLRLLKEYVHEECAGWHENIAVSILFIVSITFLIFTTCMLLEQVEAIETNASKIARMKMRVGQAGTELSRVTEEFNEMFGGDTNQVVWHWFLPLPVEFPRSMKKVVLGYEWDETFDACPYNDGSGDDHEAKIEMSSQLGKTNNKHNDLESGLGNNTNNDTLDAGDEGSFVGGSSITLDTPALKQRGGSRGPDGRSKNDTKDRTT